MKLSAVKQLYIVLLFITLLNLSSVRSVVAGNVLTTSSPSADVTAIKPSPSAFPTQLPTPSISVMEHVPTPTALPKPTAIPVTPSVTPSKITPTAQPSTPPKTQESVNKDAQVIEVLKTRAAATSDPCFQTLQSGETKLISKNCRIVGDVQVSTNQSSKFDTLYDFEADEQGVPSYKTGLVVSLSQDAWVKAPYGAIVSSESPQELINLLKSNGCSGGCQDVLHVVWTPQLSVCDKNLAPGEVVFVKSECNVVGDVEVGKFGGYQEKKDFSIRLYDDNPKTSHVETVASDSNLWVRAPFGASLSSRPVTQIINELKASGCNGGCSIVSTNLNPVPQCYNFGVIPAGEFRVLNVGCSVVGDIEIEPDFGPNIKLYDNDPKTGLIVIIRERTVVRAPFSAYMSGRTTEDLISQLKSTGCGGGCSSVKVINWPQ